MLFILMFVSMVGAAESKVDRFDWFDSRTPGLSTIILNDCILDIPINKTKDWCYINKRILHECDIDLKLGENCAH